ncbi:MAG: two-component system cell cycle response regulator [Halioglobus sp.]|jgi:two-component system cell cycle response regulator
MTDNAPAGDNATALSMDELLKTVLASEDLPTLPAVASRLVTLTSKENVALSDVAELVSQDVALSASVLRVANSPIYGFSQQMGSISQAVSMLGTNAIQSLALSFSLLSMKKGPSTNHFDFNAFWERSLASAAAAKLILQKVPRADAEEVFVSALLQNLGQFILASTMPEEYGKVISAIADRPDHILEIEKSMLGADHCSVGYEVAVHWGFPLSISLPILHHHDPLGYTGSDGEINFANRAIYLSDLLVKIFYSETPEAYYRQFQVEAEQLLKLNANGIDAILQGAHTAIDQVKFNFGFEAGETKSVQEILQEANIRLSILNLDYDQVNKELVKAKLSLEKMAKELQEKNESLRTLADMDGLTGIYNNRFFQSALDKEINRTCRKKNNLSLVLLDVDHFKRFNDDYGHLVGDFVLAEISKVMQLCIREYDTLARYGGEEFVLVLPETTGEEALMVAEKLRSSIEKARLKEGREEYYVTASFGVSTMLGSEEGFPGKTELIRMADVALYEAKKKGRNQTVVYAEKKAWFGKK